MCTLYARKHVKYYFLVFLTQVLQSTQQSLQSSWSIILGVIRSATEFQRYIYLLHTCSWVVYCTGVQSNSLYLDLLHLKCTLLCFYTTHAYDMYWKAVYMQTQVLCSQRCMYSQAYTSTHVIHLRLNCVGSYSVLSNSHPLTTLCGNYLPFYTFLYVE